ncbi:MAG: hypothetical protein LBL26_06675 [Peptococcaceae bacterium]|nr:hypothetical protein [Peptococcaceae bacterium]
MYHIEARIIEGMQTIGFRLSDDSGKLYDYSAERVLRLVASKHIDNAAARSGKLAGHNFNLNTLKKSIANGADISSYDIKDWVCGRAPEPNYQLIGRLMKEIGIDKYDPIAFFLAYNGSMNSDEFYVIKR